MPQAAHWDDTMNINSLLLFWDKSSRSFLIAVRSLWLHKLRSVLAMLGIIIGVVAVIVLMAFGEGTMQDALEDIKRQGATNVIVVSVKPPEDGSSQRRSFLLTYGLTYADYDRFLLLDSIVGSVPMRIFPQEIRNLHHMHTGRVVATTTSYQNVNKLEMVDGRFLNHKDDEEMRNVAVLGSDVAEALFPFQSALGQSIVLNKQHFFVVGVLKERNALTSGGGVSETFNNDVYLPLRTVLGRYGEKIYIRQSGSRSGEQVELHQVTLTISDMNKVRDAGALIRDQLEQSHLKKDWNVIVPLDRLDEAERARTRGLILLFAIASISLTVGGIGIMNIMLATVTERTREIGIRRALGAKRWDITLQFLIEAIVQTAAGGALGAIIGIALVFFVPWAADIAFNFRIPAHLNFLPIILAMSAAIFVGVFSGLYPAFRASRLDPIESLRHD